MHLSTRTHADALRLLGIVPILVVALCIALMSCAHGPQAPVAPAVVAPVPDFTAIETTVEAWEFLGAPGLLTQTPHYRLYTTGENGSIPSRLPVFMEASLHRYRTLFADHASGAMLPEPPMRMDSFVMESRREWEHLTRRLTGSRAETYLRIQRGGYSFNSTAVLFDIGIHDTLAIAGHEGWHQYTQRTFQERLPTWMEEAIGAYMEGYRWDDDAGAPEFLPWKNTERFDQLRRAVSRDRLMTLDELVSSTPKDLLDRQGRRQSTTLTYYAQLWALTHFLMEAEGGRYRDGLVRMVNDAAAGRYRATLESYADARAARATVMSGRGALPLMAYINADLDELSAQYVQFIEEAARPGGRGPIVEGRSPLE